MHLYDDIVAEYTLLIRPGARLLTRKEYIHIIKYLIDIANRLQLANDDLEVQLDGERERRRKLQEAPRD